jgi:hypothetical protein
MTSNPPTPATRPLAGESKATLLGAAILLAMGGLVILAGAILTVAAVVLGDTALQLP